MKEIPVEGYEQVVEIIEESRGLHGFIAIHNSSLGPALGGIRMYPYRSTDEALQDVLRLSKGMTYKSALAGLGLGGGKAVIIGDASRQKTEPLLLGFGKAVDALKGRYICAEDVGTTTSDMSVIRRATPYVTALLGKSSSGDPSVFTAFGVYRGLQALAQTLWGKPDLKDRKIAVQGIGKVGSQLADLLFWGGAQLVLCDTDAEHAAELAVRYGADVVPPGAILDVGCDLFAPCALGAIFDDVTIPKLKCKGIGGSANNQLRELSHGALLFERGILYAPDYVINAGGVINVSCELDRNGYNARRARQKVEGIFDVLLDIFRRSHATKRPTNSIADELAEEKLRTGEGKRQIPIRW